MKASSGFCFSLLLYPAFLFQTWHAPSHFFLASHVTEAHNSDRQTSCATISVYSSEIIYSILQLPFYLSIQASYNRNSTHISSTFISSHVFFLHFFLHLSEISYSSNPYYCDTFLCSSTKQNPVNSTVYRDTQCQHWNSASHTTKFNLHDTTH